MIQAPDYAMSLMQIQELRKQASEASHLGKWSEVCDLADEIVVTAHKLRIYCLDRLESQHQLELPL
jgi:hypothetical protein